MVLADSTRARPRRTEQDRKGRNRAGRTAERDPPRHAAPRPTESPSKANVINNRFARRRRMASPGPAPPCEQAKNLVSP